MKYKSQQQEIKEEEFNIKKTKSFIYKLVKKIHTLNLLYKLSFKKKYYIKFKDIKDLQLHRQEIEDKIFNLNKKLDFQNTYLNKCNNNLTKMYNNLVYYEILFNKN